MHNAYIAGYWGYVELAKLALQPLSEYQAHQIELERLLNLRLQNFTVIPFHQYSKPSLDHYYSMITVWNFLYLTQELADYLMVNIPAAVQQAIDTYTAIAPHWMLAHNGETQGENAMMPYQQTYTLFQARSLVLHQSKAELYKYLDAEAVAPAKPLWIEDAMPVLYSDSWRQFKMKSPVRVMTGEKLVVLAKYDGSGAIRINDRIGNVRPLHCTALGKVMLSTFEPEQFEAFLRDTELPVFTGKTIRTVQQLRQEIAEVRRCGVAFDDGEVSEELRCAAVPVFNFTNQVIGSLGISGPGWRLSIQALHKNTIILQQAAEQLSSELGARHGHHTKRPDAQPQNTNA